MWPATRVDVPADARGETRPPPKRPPLAAEFRCRVSPAPLASKKGWGGTKYCWNGMTQMKHVSWAYCWGTDYKRRGALPKGVEFVLVNGVLVVRDGATVEDVFPGRPVMGRLYDGS